jgi:hypothetical protein
VIAARSRARRRRRHVSHTVAGVLGATALIGVIGWMGPSLQDDEGASQVDDSHVAAPNDPEQVRADESGEVLFEGAFACTGSFTPQDAAGADFAFDGTVASIQDLSDDQVDVDLRTVTLQVHEWFHGSDEPEVTVTTYAPKDLAGSPSYEVGTRLLVSGDQDGDVRVAPPCGATRYFDPESATSWRRAAHR